MIIGVPREIKTEEYRVAVVPAGVRSLTSNGHGVLIEQGAGLGSGISDGEYQAAGAEIVAKAEEVWQRAQMIIKVKEPLPPEYPFLRQDLIIYTYLHLAPEPELTEQLLARQVTAIGYETVQLADGSLPLLVPMSQVAGRMAVQVGAHFLERPAGGSGVLLAGLPGVKPGHVTILGSGTVASNAALMAMGLGARTTIVARNMARLDELATIHHGRLTTLVSNQANIERELSKADLVIGGVLVPGGSAPKLISRAMLGLMKKGSLIVDVAIDQGGCCETSQPTYHSDPVYQVAGINHYCVANMPGAVPRTATFGLTNVTLPYALAIANQGLATAAEKDPALARGINSQGGRLTNEQVARAQNRPWQPY
ncbi:MAG: alanine dehydrogenase [Thermodesulfobacteriota bacterium]